MPKKSKSPKKEEIFLRSILITVMMLIVVAVMFTNMISDDTTGIKAKIEEKGTAANTKISGLSTN